jgi:hypothetical protein
MKRLMICAISLMIIFSFVGISFAADNPGVTLTKDKLAYMLVNLLGIKMPDNIGTLSEKEAFEIMANALASKGINSLLKADPVSEVAYCDLVEILYVVLKRTEPLDTNGKMQYLVKNGYMSMKDCAAKVTVEEAAEILKNPAFTGLIAEAYSEPEGSNPNGAAGGIGAPNVVADEPASQI